MKDILKKVPLHYVAIAVGFLYSFIICFYFFKAGYLWGLDYFFPLFWWIPDTGINGYIIWILSSIFKHMLSLQVLEKTIIFWAFFLPFVWWVYILKKSKSLWAMVFAGIAITCNPYFYARFVDGQLGMYLLFCTIPFWLMSLFYFFSCENKKICHYIVPIVLSLITTSISMHGALFLLISFVVFLAVFVWGKYIWKTLWQSFLLGLGIVLVNLYWIIPNVVDVDGAQGRIDNFGSADIAVFENYLWKANNYITTLSLQWYRGEWYKRFIPSYGSQKYPFIVFLVLFVIILLWVYHTLKDKDPHHKKLSIAILILTITWYILWLWTAGDTIFAGMNTFLYNHMPLYNAMRESHKRVLLMVIWYAYFGAYGTHFIWKMFGTKKYNYTIICISIIMILVWYTPSIFLLSKQIPVVDYPIEWYELREKLIYEHTPKDDCSPKCYDILVLPRHQYMRFSFVGINVLNPAQMFFRPLRVLQWDNIEIGPLYAQTNNPASKIVTSYLDAMDIIDGTWDIIDHNAFVRQLKNMWIWYILLFKEVDYPAYEQAMFTMSHEGLVIEKLHNDQFILYIID